MPKFIVYAKEVVYYMVDVEAKNKDEVKKFLYKNEIDFNPSDITDGGDFEVLEIEEIENVSN